MAIIERAPPLAAGDKLTREEFLSRWEAHPEIKLAELVKGIVYMPSPVTVEHSDMDGDVGAWLGVYHAATPGTASGRNGTSFLLDDTPQPDLNLRLLPEYGGASWTQDGYLHGVPELLVEVCKSSASYDLHAKYDLYQEARVPEYLAILIFEKQIRWHILTGDTYQLLPADEDGIWRSCIFPGLWLDGQALLAGNLQRVLKRLNKGMKSPEYKDFVAKLRGQ